ncbi:hypothetical protein [Brevundimonas diminuta]|uniref:hypothetical protein n=1 Tax=Brevundimonas diminuta TaxID=293 RepID=UPI003207FAA2
MVENRLIGEIGLLFASRGDEGEASIEDGRDEIGTQAQGRGVVSILSLHGAVDHRQSVIGPQAIIQVLAHEELVQHHLGFVVAPFAGQPHRIAIGLGFRIDGLGLLAQQVVQFADSAFGPAGGPSADAGRHRDASIGQAKHLAGQPGLTAEPVAQIAPQFADRYAGAGDLDGDVVAPVVGVGRGGAQGIGLGLHVGELIEQLRGQYRTGQTALHQVRRRGEGLGDDAAGLSGVPDEEGRGRERAGAQGGEDEIAPAKSAELGRLMSSGLTVLIVSPPPSGAAAAASASDGLTAFDLDLISPSPCAGGRLDKRAANCVPAAGRYPFSPCRFPRRSPRQSVIPRSAPFQIARFAAEQWRYLRKSARVG